jgi:hypothetical protein
MVLQARRWLPGRELALLGDSGFAALDPLATLARHGLICITRLRLDAALYEPAPPRRPGAVGRPRTKGARLPNLAAILADEATRRVRVTVPGWYGEGDRAVELCSSTAVWRHAGPPVVPIRPSPARPAIPVGPDRCLWHRWVLLRDPQRRFDPQALLCTDPARDPGQIVRWFVQRWQIGAERCSAPFREARDHLGVETQRPYRPAVAGRFPAGPDRPPCGRWSDRAIARTTPCLLALFSIVTLLAARLGRRARAAVCTDAWYRKPRPTFADGLAAVRRQFRWEQGLLMSRWLPEATKLHPSLRHGIAYALCHAA